MRDRADDVGEVADDRHRVHLCGGLDQPVVVGTACSAGPRAPGSACADPSARAASALERSQTRGASIRPWGPARPGRSRGRLRERRRVAPAPAWACCDQFSSSAITAGCLSTQMTTQVAGGWPGPSRGGRPRSRRAPPRPACSGRRRPSPARTPSITSPATSPGWRPRWFSSSRTMTTSKWWAAISPSSRMSSSRRSPAVAMMPMRDGRARSCESGLADPVDEVAELSHGRRVVAVVDDHVDAVDVDLVEAAGGEVVVGREGAQALADVVQRGAGRERRGGRGEGVLHVHPGPAAERRRQQVGPGELHLAAAVLDHDHLAALGGVEDQRLAAATAVGVDHLADLGAGLLHREPDDLAGAAPPHLADQRVVGVEHGVAVAGHRLDEDGLDVGELLDGVDAAQAEVVGLHVEHDGDVVALVAEALAQDAAAGDLEDGEVDARVLQHHPGAARARGVGADQQPLVDDHAVGGGHADLAAHALEDVGDHPGWSWSSRWCR